MGKKLWLRFIILFYLLSISFSSYSQSADAALNVTLSKNTAPYILDYQTGFHTVFINNKELLYHRMNYDFQLESKGSVDLHNMGSKLKLEELSAERKNIYLFYSRADSIGLRCFTTNTINNKSSQSVVDENYTRKCQLINHFSVQDSSYFIYLNEEKKLTLSITTGPKLLGTMQIDIDQEHIDYWVKTIRSIPQLSKSAIIKSQSIQAQKIPFNPVKIYYKGDFLYATLEKGYSTVYIQQDIKKKTTTSKVIPFNANAASSGSIFNSYLINDHLYQMLWSPAGCTLQKTDMQSDSIRYSMWVKPQMEACKKSMRLLVNRGEEGSIEKNSDRPVVLHKEQFQKYLAIFVSQKGGMDHFMISEIAPLKNREEWLKAENNISTDNIDRGKKDILTTIGIRSQTPLHYSFLQNLQCMYSSFSFSIDYENKIQPYLGDEQITLARSVALHHKFLENSVIPRFETVGNIDGSLYYCVYRKSKHLYYFIKL